MWKNLRLRELYSNKDIKIKKKLHWIIESLIIVLGMGYFFYRSLIACILLIPLGIVYLSYKYKTFQEKQKEIINHEFMDGISSVSASLQAGYSLENAFIESYEELIILYGSDNILVKEWNIMIKGMENNITIETQMLRFAERFQINDIKDFAQIISLAKRGGGNLVEIIQNTVRIMNEKMQVNKEIAVLIAAKKLEQEIMNAIPFFIIAYLSITSKGFFDVLYGNMMGIVIMTFCLAIYIIAFCISKKIVEIRI